MVGLGGNLAGPLGDPDDYIAAAVDRLEASDGVFSLRVSGLYRTAPWGRTDQEEFCNAVAEVICGLPAGQLLDELLDIERRLGRRRGVRWGPRHVDLDLLTFDCVTKTSERLTLPHPRMHQRAFVLVPLLELDAEFEIPGKGRADACLAALGDSQQVVPLRS